MEKKKFAKDKWVELARVCNTKYSKYITFLFAMYISAMFVDGISPVSGSGDAASIWESIKGLADGRLVPSYVMYKGVLSCYPYVWLYKLSCLFGTSEYFFVKLYMILLFSYSVSIAFPNIFEKLSDKKCGLINRILLVIALFEIWKSISIIDQLTIDLPSMACFLAIVDISLNIKKTKKITLIEFWILMFLLGASLCFSGQYSCAIIIIIVYDLFQIYSVRKTVFIFSIKRIITILCGLVLFLVCPISDKVFFRNIVNVLIEKGEWIPLKEDWLILGLTQNQEFYSAFNPQINSTKGYEIYLQMVSNPTLLYDPSLSNSQRIGMIVSTWLKHPVDMIQLWWNRLFIGLSPDKNICSVLWLSISYIALFSLLMYLVKMLGKKKNFYKDYFPIYLAFLFTVLVPCALHMESRYAITMQGLMYTFLFLGIGRKEMLWMKADENNKYHIDIVKLLVAFVFVISCLVHFGTLIELHSAQIGMVRWFHW